MIRIITLKCWKSCMILHFKTSFSWGNTVQSLRFFSENCEIHWFWDNSQINCPFKVHFCILRPLDNQFALGKNYQFPLTLRRNLWFLSLNTFRIAGLAVQTAWLSQIGVLNATCTQKCRYFDGAQLFGASWFVNKTVAMSNDAKYFFQIKKDACRCRTVSKPPCTGNGTEASVPR